MSYKEECEKLYIENKVLKSEINEFLNGHKGACRTCELVAEANKKMKELIDWLWENEPEKTEILDKIQEYLKKRGGDD